MIWVFEEKLNKTLSERKPGSRKLNRGREGVKGKQLKLFHKISNYPDFSDLAISKI